MVSTRPWQSLLCFLGFLTVLALTQSACSDEGGAPPQTLPGHELPIDQLLPQNPLRITEADFVLQSDGTRQAVIEIPHLGSDQALTLIALHSTQLDRYEPDPSKQEELLSFELITTGLENPKNTTGTQAQALSLSATPSHPPSHDDQQTESFKHHLALLSHGPQTLTSTESLQLQKYASGGWPLPKPFGKCRGPYVIDETSCHFEIIINDSDQEPHTAILRHTSERALFFVDEKNTGDFDSNDWTLLSTIYDQKLPLLERYFGNMPDTDANGKVIIVFSSALSKTGANGYVGPWDLATEELFPSQWISNQGDIVYANTPSGVALWGWSKASYLEHLIQQTLLHESKHIISSWQRIQKGQTREAPWIEEPSAFAALELIGLGMPGYTTQKSFAAVGLTQPDHFRLLYEYYPTALDSLRAMYGFNMLFLWRVAERVGHESFWLKLVSNEKTGRDNLEEVAKSAYPGGFAEMLEDWALTLRFDGDTTHPEFEMLGFLKPELNLRDGSWAPLGVRSMGQLNSVAAFYRQFFSMSVGFFEGRGDDQRATVTLILKNPKVRPHFLLVAHRPIKSSSQ